MTYNIEVTEEERQVLMVLLEHAQADRNGYLYDGEGRYRWYTPPYRRQRVAESIDLKLRRAPNG